MIDEDLKNVGGRHDKTAKGTRALKKMHDAPGVLASLSDIDRPEELAQVIQAIDDAAPITGREEILKAIKKVLSHERSTRNR
jgi:hypothetical protein